MSLKMYVTVYRIFIVYYIMFSMFSKITEEIRKK